MEKTDKNPLNEMEQLAATITKGTKNTLRDILSEAVSTYLREEVLNEEDEEKDDEEISNEEPSDAPEFDENSEEATESDNETLEDENAEEPMDVEDAEDTEDVEDADSNEDEWSEFEEYKINNEDGSEEYDFTNETDKEKYIKVFKLMKDDDNVSIVQDGGKINIKDNENDTEYVIELNCDNNDCENEITMAESLGYTDNYQDKDPIEGLTMGDKPKNTNDWHKGVPTGAKKPWAGKGNSKPFEEKAEPIFEITLNDNVEEEEVPVDEATNVGGFVQQNSTSKSHVPNSSGRKARNMSQDGVKKTGTADPRYSGVVESLQKKIDNALTENKQLKETVAKVTNIMKEAVQVNVNLGHIVRLMVENTTTKAEKEDIVKRFNKVTSNDEAKKLYESISSELQKSHSNVISEQIINIDNNNNKINESKIYDQPNSVRDMMRRMHMIK